MSSERTMPRFARDLANGLVMIIPCGLGVAISAHWWETTGDQWWVYAPAYAGIAASGVLTLVLAMRLLMEVVMGGGDDA